MRHPSPAADQQLDSRSASLHLRRLAKVYTGGQVALGGVQACLEGGALTVVVGPSGSGKTTLLRLLAGLEPPTDGEIWWGAQRIDGWPPHRRRVRMVFQQALLYPQLTIGANLQQAARRHRGGEHGETIQIEGEIAEQLGIAELLDRYPDQVSGGELQRAAIARAVIGRPNWLLLDEPFNHLDPPRRWEMRAWFAAVQQRLAVTTVLVTHDPLEALMLGQHVLVLDQGNLLQAGSPADVYLRPATLQVARFFGVAGMNLIPGCVTDRQGRWQFAGGGLEILLDHHPCPGERLDDDPRIDNGESENREPATTAVVLGVRPEHIRVTRGSGDANQAVVTRVDWLGAQSLAWMRVRTASPSAAAELRVVVPSEVTVQPGSIVTLELGSGRLCFFGHRSGRNLAHPSRMESP